MGALEEAVVVRELAHLFRGDVRELIPAVADVDAPEPRHRVEDLLAFGIDQVHALGVRNDARAFGRERAEVRERMHVVPGVDLLPLARYPTRAPCLRAHDRSPGLRRSTAGVPFPRS